MMLKTFLKNKLVVITVGIVLTLGLVYMGSYLYRNRTVAVVGDYKISARDVQLQDEVTRVFYPETKEFKGKDILIKVFSYAQILKNNGAEVTEAKLRSEDMRINKNTKSPETLEKIKKVFGGDEDAYLKVFIMKTYVERTIYSDFFNRSPSTQAESLKKVADLISRAQKSKKSFKELATEQSLFYKKFSVSSREGFVWDIEEKEKRQRLKASRKVKDVPQMKDASPKSADSARAQEQMDQRFAKETSQAVRLWIEEIIPQLKVGDVLQEPVDHSESWLVVRLTNIRKGSTAEQNVYEMEAIEVPKNKFDVWLKAETEKIVIKQ